MLAAFVWTPFGRPVYALWLLGLMAYAGTWICWQRRADPLPATFLAALLEAAVLIGDRDAADVLAHRLADLSRFAAGPSYLTCIARHLGGAAALSGRPDQARSYYQTAMKLTEKIRNRPEAALSRFELSRLLFEKYPDESGEARRHLDFARAEFRDMKMVSALERASKNGFHTS